jgi:hypothetical protein
MRSIYFHTELLSVISQHCVNLAVLAIVLCKRENSNTKPSVTELEMVAVVRGCRKLQENEVDESKPLGVAVAVTRAQCCSHLRSLNFERSGIAFDGRCPYTFVRAPPAAQKPWWG